MYKVISKNVLVSLRDCFVLMMWTQAYHC